MTTIRGRRTWLPAAAVLLVVAATSCCVMPRQAAALDATEFLSIDFNNLIRNPLMAVIQAQMLSAQTMLGFVNDVGFERDSNGNFQAKLMEYKYDTVDEEGQEHEGSIQIPILCMVPIPYLRIESAFIEFNAKLSQSFKTQAGFELGFSASFDSAFAGPQAFVAGTLGGTRVTASFDMKVKASASFQEQKSYSMHVAVQATQPEMPEGALKVLDALRSAARRRDKQARTA